MRSTSRTVGSRGQGTARVGSPRRSQVAWPQAIAARSRLCRAPACPDRDTLRASAGGRVVAAATLNAGERDQACGADKGSVDTRVGLDCPRRQRRTSVELALPGKEERPRGAQMLKIVESTVSLRSRSAVSASWPAISHQPAIKRDSTSSSYRTRTRPGRLASGATRGRRGRRNSRLQTFHDGEVAGYVVVESADLPPETLRLSCRKRRPEVVEPDSSPSSQRATARYPSARTGVGRPSRRTWRSPDRPSRCWPASETHACRRLPSSRALRPVRGGLLVLIEKRQALCDTLALCPAVAGLPARSEACSATAPLRTSPRATRPAALPPGRRAASA